MFTPRGFHRPLGFVCCIGVVNVSTFDPQFSLIKSVTLIKSHPLSIKYRWFSACIAVCSGRHSDFFLKNTVEITDRPKPQFCRDLCN